MARVLAEIEGRWRYHQYPAPGIGGPAGSFAFGAKGGEQLRRWFGVDLGHRFPGGSQEADQGKRRQILSNPVLLCLGRHVGATK